MRNLTTKIAAIPSPTPPASIFIFPFALLTNRVARALHLEHIYTNLDSSALLFRLSTSTWQLSLMWNAWRAVFLWLFVISNSSESFLYSCSKKKLPFSHLAEFWNPWNRRGHVQMIANFRLEQSEFHCTFFIGHFLFFKQRRVPICVQFLDQSNIKHLALWDKILK